MAQTGYVNRNGGFVVASQRSIDRRLLLSKAEMKSVTEKCLGKFSNGDSFVVPANYFCICSDDSKMYLFDATSTELSEETGRYKCLETSVIEEPTFKEKLEDAIEESQTIEDLTTTVGDSESGLVKEVADLTDKIDNISIDGGEIE